MSRRNTRVFETKVRNGVLEVWLPPVDHPEGEMVLAIAPSYLPALIATLRNCVEGGAGTPNLAMRLGGNNKKGRYDESSQDNRNHPRRSLDGIVGRLRFEAGNAEAI